MTEKYFAATPFTCHNQYLEKHKIILRTHDNCIMAYGRTTLKLKDFEDIYATADQKQSHSLGLQRRRPQTDGFARHHR